MYPYWQLRGVNFTRFAPPSSIKRAGGGPRPHFRRGTSTQGQVNTVNVSSRLRGTLDKIGNSPPPAPSEEKYSSARGRPDHAILSREKALLAEISFTFSPIRFYSVSSPLSRKRVQDPREFRRNFRALIGIAYRQRELRSRSLIRQRTNYAVARNASSVLP